ncbi:transcriptional repressor p66 alpha isoform X1 [Scophthalmus maximus]|uniref:transcriptional repressor p66 alpha isoform X1 n=1 Tax=Scophthalmus maximus TaxID=52904 RepID=UPI0015E0ABDA|nr:transcriptional repressor p66 alpha isoform X1 [Scophthalmus maximus]XP_035491729.1 transcriptional repressor p66 alpha isoform X1 [Scophthalmus maximus]XP_035491730.1 transcriptional repressor p66 alpha isoform X1 [Scophthalmus maximus]XP_035491731.1 transcriptional repressor p66 alpha isoform X1 [Scophthalmus maximus]XP_035491732.1 transcriptional repressor p66 alpha isoform X1 [Scophthalmus maximus]XP_035491733.1 transcriptional repressor p66 alpha isoform X1 [Scophthalmus maximus]XP_03
MSEEAVRQTRSQKRALVREGAPQSTENSDNENDIKKPKLDPSEPTAPAQTTPKPDPELAQDGRSRTSTGSEHEDEQEQSCLPLPSALPLAPNDDREQSPRQHAAEPSSDNRTDCSDRASSEGTEPAVDTRSRARPTEPKASSGMLTAGEVKATIKVEVQTGEQPVDMSTSRGSIKREKRPPSPDDDDDDDVIILSDNDSPSPPMNGLSHFKELDTDLLMKSSPAEREQIIKQLKEELRLEEAKLVLLKKLRQSQIQRDTLQKPSGLTGSSAAPPPLIRGTNTSNKGSQQILTGRSSGTVIPPPLVRGGQQVSSKHGSQIIMPPLVRGAQPISVSPQQIQALRQQQQQQQQLAASGGSGSGPPPLLLGPRTSAPTAQGQRGMVQSALIRIGNSANMLASASSLKGSSSGSSSLSGVGVNDSPASRHAAAKLALRKQLEKTLLEIPPPKPPAPEFNFLPSAANNEFIYLVGLEEVVQNLLDTIHRGKTGVPLSKATIKDPFICTQCNTDFTCRWRQDKTKGGAMLCEDCMSSNQKKVLKAEHTSRLKAAFVKALQQEQEIEQRIIQQTSSSVSHSSSSSASSLKVEQLVSQQLKQAQARASSLQHHHQASRAANIIHHHSIKSSQGQLSHGVSSVGVRGVPHSFSSSSQLQSAVAAAALVSRPGKHAHVSHRSVQSSKVSSSGIGGGRNISGGSASSTAWKKQSNSNTGVTMAYVNPSLTGHKTSATVDARQREYLLGMIPSRSSISQTANTWK